MENLAKLLNVLSIIDNMEDFIKICALDYKMNPEVARELLRMIGNAKDQL